MTKSKWVLDASHSLVEFSVKHMMIATVKGRFSSLQGEILVDPAEIAGAEFSVTVDASSIDTREAQRDEHLKSADFFDVATYPTLTFLSRSVEPKGDDEYALVGELTMHGVTREVNFNLTYEGQGRDPWGNTRIGFTATATVNRKDYGLTWNAALETGGVLVGETVKIEIHTEAIKQ